MDMTQVAYKRKYLLSATLEPAFHLQLSTFSLRLRRQHFLDPWLVSFYICECVNILSAK